MLITAYFSSSGAPATGLTPTVTVRDVSDGSVVVNAQAMTEIANGYYKYDFATYVSTKDYVILCDGGIALVGTERYAIAASGDYSEISGIKTKTDGLNFTGSYVQSQVKGQDNIDFGALQKASITAAVPAVDLSGVATAANLTIVDTVVDAIKLKTDTLGGAGSVPWPFQVIDSVSGLPVDDAPVTVTTDSQGLNVRANGITDATGYVTPTFRLDPGGYYFWVSADGKNPASVYETVA